MLEAYFLLFAQFGLKTSFLYLANDAKLGKFVNSNAWRYSLFPLAPYEYPKMPVILGLRPPRVSENSIAKAGEGESKKAEKRKSISALKREAKQAKWAEAVQLMTPKSCFIEFTNSPNLLDEPMDTDNTSVGVMVDDVVSGVSVMELPSQPLAPNCSLTSGEESMTGVEFGTVSQELFSSLINVSPSVVQMPPDPEATDETTGEY
jgi:hypothetical protein